MSIALADSTPSSERIASFLLAWADAGAHGGFDLTDLWSVDQDLGLDMLAVVSLIASSRGVFPKDLGYELEFDELAAKWTTQNGVGRRSQAAD